MRLFALGDTHLSFGRPTPMDVFGDVWRDHPAKIAAGWDGTVGADDVVAVVGDVSWARTEDEVRPDLEFLAARPGRLKVLLRGNHDSWWTSRARVRRLLPEGMTALQNDALRLDEGVVLCGARGWEAPGMPWFDEAKDLPVYERELRRLDLSLDAAARLAREGDRLVALLHYPPIGPGQSTSPVLERLERAGVVAAAYGHLHGSDHAWAPRGRFGGVELFFVAGDAVDFTPQCLLEVD
ncbi:MAG: metallophosphoesterase [Acidobacteriota bacterium]